MTAFMTMILYSHWPVGAFIVILPYGQVSRTDKSPALIDRTGGIPWASQLLLQSTATGTTATADITIWGFAWGSFSIMANTLTMTDR
jgi:hypothetical protein